VTRCGAVTPRERGESHPVVTVLVTRLSRRSNPEHGICPRSLIVRRIRRRWWSSSTRHVLTVCEHVFMSATRCAQQGRVVTLRLVNTLDPGIEIRSGSPVVGKRKPVVPCPVRCPLQDQRVVAGLRSGHGGHGNSGRVSELMPISRPAVATAAPPESATPAWAGGAGILDTPVVGDLGVADRAPVAPFRRVGTRRRAGLISDPDACAPGRAARSRP
jgi:hypothetical protein